MKRGEKVKRKQPKTQTAFAKKRKIPTGKISKSDVDKIAKTYKKYRKAAPMAKKAAKKGVSRLIPYAGQALLAYEGVKGAVKVGKSLKARKACKDKGGVFSKGFCITGKGVKRKK